MRSFVHKNRYYITLGVLFLIALFLRGYRLATLPDMIHIDEAGLGCNAWCIANFGVDRYLNEMPFYAENYNYSGQSPLYTYSTALLIATIGKGHLSLLLARIPGFLASMLVVIFGTKSMALAFQNRKITLMSAALLTICPYFIMHGRFALDCNLMLGCSTVALYLLLKYIRSQKLLDLVLCGIAFGITLYSYALSYFLLPMFLILITLYLLYTGKITFRRSIVWACSVCITGLPVILFACSLLFKLEPIHFWGFVISPIASDRMSDVANYNFFENIKNIIQITLTHDSYLFDATDKFYTMYVISIPFILIGFFYGAGKLFLSLKNRSFHVSAIYWIFYICGLITNGLTSVYYVYHGNFCFISYLYFLVSGIYATYRFVRPYRYAFLGILSACYLLWGLSFCRYYFGIYTLTDAYTSLYIPPYVEVVADAHNLESAQDIYIDSHGKMEYFYFFYPESPYEVSFDRSTKEQGRYHFEIDSDTPIETGNAYIISRKNDSFINRLMVSGMDYERVDYECYYLFYLK